MRVSLLTQCIPGRDGQRAVGLETERVATRSCSLRASGEHANLAKLLGIVGFSVSPPVNPLTACSPVQIRDSSQTSEGLQAGLLIPSEFFLQKSLNRPFSAPNNHFFGLVSEIKGQKRAIFEFFRVL